VRPAPRQKAPGPPPISVGQLPQPSVTVSCTVAACPAVTRCTVSPIDAGCPGKITVVGVLTAVTGEVATCTVAFVSELNCSETSWLFPFAQAASRAVIVVCSVPPPGATCTPTAGSGKGVGVIVGVFVGGSVFVAVGVRVAVAVLVGVFVGVGVRVGVAVFVDVLVGVGVRDACASSVTSLLLVPPSS
jgi:hypothetical protein